LILRTRIADKVFTIQTGREKHIVHLEFQLRYGHEIPKRMFVYAGALTTKYDLEVSSVLILIKPPRRKGHQIGVYRSHLAGKITNEFHFPVVPLWELRDAILSGYETYRTFAPLLLELEPKPDIALLRKVLDLINLEVNSKRRAELYGCTLALADRHFSIGTVRSIIKEAKMTGIVWEEIPIIGDEIKAKYKKLTKEARAQALEQGRQQGLEKGLREGRKEGLEEGREKALQESVQIMHEVLFEILNNQFDKVPKRIMRAIQSVNDPRRLKTIMKRTLKANSVAEIEKLLTAGKKNSKTHLVARNRR